MPVPPGIRAGRPRTLEWLRASEWKRRAADGGAVVPGTGRGAPGMHNTTTEPIRRSRAVLRMHGMRHTARPAQLPSIAVLCMLREPPRACDPPPPTLRCQPSDPIRRRHGRTLKTTATAAGHGRTLKTTATAAGHGRPAERHCGDGPLGIHASPNGPAAIPSGGRRAQRDPKSAWGPQAGYQFVGATITGWPVGTRLPPAGSSVTRSSRTPRRSPGIATSAAPALSTLNSAAVGAGAACGRSSHTS